MAGSPEAMAVEGAYLSALSNVTSWVINREELVLKSAGKDLLLFRAE